jgi:hypothetical protein
MKELLIGACLLTVMIGLILILQAIFLALL